MFKTCQIWGYFWQRFMTIVQPTCTLKTLSEALPNLTKLNILDYLKKLPWYISNFCLIGKIHHNFLVLRMIELDFLVLSLTDSIQCTEVEFTSFLFSGFISAHIMNPTMNPSPKEFSASKCDWIFLAFYPFKNCF